MAHWGQGFTLGCHKWTVIYILRWPRPWSLFGFGKGRDRPRFWTDDWDEFNMGQSFYSPWWLILNINHHKPISLVSVTFEGFLNWGYPKSSISVFFFHHKTLRVQPRLRKAITPRSQKFRKSNTLLGGSAKGCLDLCCLKGFHLFDVMVDECWWGIHPKL